MHYHFCQRGRGHLRKCHHDVAVWECRASRHFAGLVVFFQLLPCPTPNIDKFSLKKLEAVGHPRRTVLSVTVMEATRVLTHKKTTFDWVNTKVFSKKMYSRAGFRFRYYFFRNAGQRRQR